MTWKGTGGFGMVMQRVDQPIETRVAELEATQRRLLVVVSVLACGLLVMVACAMAPSSDGVISTERLQIMEGGCCRVMLSVTDEGRAVVEFMNRNGTSDMSLSTGPNGGSRISLSGQPGQHSEVVGIEIEVDRLREDHIAPRICLRSALGMATRTLELGMDETDPGTGTTLLKMTDERREGAFDAFRVFPYSSVELTADSDEGGKLVLRSSETKVLATLPSE